MISSGELKRTRTHSTLAYGRFQCALSLALYYYPMGGEWNNLPPSTISCVALDIVAMVDNEEKR